MTDFAKLVLDADTKGLKNAERDLDSVGGKARDTAMKIGKSMRRVGLGLTAGVTVPLATAAAASISMASDFQKSMSNVSTLIDPAVESMADMEKQVLDIARRTPVAIDELTTALYDVRSAGIDASDAMDVLEQSARLGVAGLGTTKESVDLVTSSINAFNIEGAEQARVYDLIFKAVKNGKTDISQLSQNFGAVAGTVSKAGVELDEYLASVAAMTTTGLPAAQAHTQIRAAIAGLTRDTKETAKVFGALGADNFPDLIQKSGGMVKAFQRISEELGGNDADIIKLVGSVEAYNAMVALTGGQNEAFTSTLDDMRNGANAVDEAFEKQNGTLAANAQRTENAMQSMGISIGSILMPFMEQLAGAISGLANGFLSLSPNAQAFIVFIAGFAAVVGPLLIVLGTFVTMAPAIATALGVIKGAAVLLMTNPVILGFAAVLAGIYLAWQNWDEIKAIVAGVGEAVSAWYSEHIKPTFDAVMATLQPFIDFFRDYFTAQIKDGLSLISALLEGDFSGAWEIAKGMVARAAQAMSQIVSALGQGIKNVLVSIAQAVAGKAMDIINSMIQIGRDIISGMVNGIKANAGMVWEAIKDVVKGSIGWAKFILGIASPSKVFAELGGWVSEGFANGIEEATPKVDAAIMGLASGAEKLADGAEIQTVRIQRTFKDMADGVLGSLQKLTSSIKGGGFLDILSSVIGFGLELGGAGLFGKSVQTSINSAPARANGGAVSAGQTYLVGERGPELFTSNGNGFVTPNAGNDNGGVHVTVGIDPATGNLVAFVDGRIQSAAPAIANGGAQVAQQRIGRAQSRSVR